MIVIFSTYVELFVLIPHIIMINVDAFLILGGPLIRAFAFGTVGMIVNQLVAVQLTQRRELILANIRLSEHSQTLERLAISRERNRLARELHDTLAHTLSGQAVNLEAIKLMIPPYQIEIHHMLDHSLENTRSGLADTRRALKALRSQQLEDLGLEMAIQNLASDAASRGGFSITTKIFESSLEITPDIEQSIFRIVQETLENIIRHANANHVDIILEQDHHDLLLSISDDGSGFDLRTAENLDRLGIQGMRERATLIQGELTILSAPGNGTTVRLSVPLFWNEML